MVGLKVGLLWYEIGNDNFLFSFFSTICYNLEKKEWGSIYPVLMDNFYSGYLPNSLIPEALKELLHVKKRLSLLPPSKVIWNIDKLSEQPPWGENISDEITNLSNYFIASNGVLLFELLEEAFWEAQKGKNDLSILNM